MGKKIVIICSVLAVLLFGGIAFGFYSLFKPTTSVEEIVFDQMVDPLSAVPSDAVLIYDFDSFNDFKHCYISNESHFSHFINPKSQLVEFLNIFNSDIKNDGAVLSLHYPLKNSVSFLLVISITDESQRVKLIQEINDATSGVINKKYSGQIIYKSVVPEISYSIYGNFLIASTSHVTVESSIRHLEGNTSILDNPQFIDAYRGVKGKNLLFFNHKNLGKLFSGAVNREHLGAASFFTTFSSWSSFVINDSRTLLSGEGRVLNTKDVAEYSNILSLQKSKVSKIYDVLPHNTQYFFTLPMNNSKEFLSSYASYLEANKRINDYRFKNAMAPKGVNSTLSTQEWVDALGVEELAVASIPFEDRYEKVVLVRVVNKNISSSDFNFYSGYISALFGEFFKSTAEELNVPETYSVIEDWMVIGGADVVSKLAFLAQSENFHSLRDFISQTPAESILKMESSLMGVVNLSKFADSLSMVIKPEYSHPIAQGISDYTFNLLSYTVSNKGGNLISSFSWHSDNITPIYIQNVVEDETVVEIPAGPYKVKNFLNGKSNYISQLDDNRLRLLDENKRGVWTIPFDAPISGYVAQVDYFKNNKLQMIFCSGSKLYMLDRLGRWVKPFPIDLGKDVLLGPVVYDFKKKKDYSIMVLHQDNLVSMYDMNGKPIPSWHPISLPEKIKEMPTLLTIDNAKYWVVRTGYQTVICHQDGIPVSEFTRKKRLAPDTNIEVKSSVEVEVISIEGKKVVLNLQSGAMKKL